MPHSQKRSHEDSESESGSDSDVLNLDDMTVAQLKEVRKRRVTQAVQMTCWFPGSAQLPGAEEYGGKEDAPCSG